ncbi:MAG TPA: glycosyltransferase family 1 protein [Vicinamibacterales bacterium]
MRILIDYRPALRERSGVGEYIHQLTQGLVRVSAGRDEIALFSSSLKDRLPGSPIPGTRAIDSRIPARVLTRLWHQYGWPPIEWLAGQFDLVHSSRPTLVPSRGAARFVTVHDLDFLDHPERTQAEFRGDYGALTRRHAQQADRVVAISAYTAGEVEARFEVPASRLVVCRPGRPDWTPRTAPPPDPYVLFVGTLELRKNVGVLLDAYAQLVTAHPDTTPRLILAGRALPETAAWLERLARPPLAGRATHLGYILDAHRESLYRNAAVLVLPSFNEGFGLPVLEAMTVGVPVVASNRGAIPEVLGDAGLLVDPTRADGIAAAMHQVLTQPQLAASLSARGIRRSRLFDWTAAAEALREAYVQTLEERTRRRGAQRQ